MNKRIVLVEDLVNSKKKKIPSMRSKEKHTKI